LYRCSRTAAGLSNWVATDIAEYQRKAIEFAADLPALATLRASLRATPSATALFDGASLAGDFEAARREIWRRSAPAESQLHSFDEP
jgi:protein O-GlcNAc transferase